MKLRNRVRSVGVVLGAAALSLTASLVAAPAAHASQGFCSVSVYWGPAFINPGAAAWTEWSNWNPGIHSGVFIQDGINDSPEFTSYLQQDRPTLRVRSGSYNSTSQTLYHRGWQTVMYAC